MNVEFEINGKKVDPQAIEDELERAILEGIKEEVESQIEPITDPETGQPPKVTLKGDDLDNLSVEVEGSEAVVRQVKDVLGE